MGKYDAGWITTPKGNAIDAGRGIWWIIVDTVAVLFGKGLK